MESKNKKLRSGYTTGACSAAAAKAAALMVLKRLASIKEVEIPFPTGIRASFAIQRPKYDSQENKAWASVIKDAGDDPDVTNGAEIRAEVFLVPQSPDAPIVIKGGVGVGRVTKPGLAVPVGEPAINPVPRKMILAAVGEAVAECGLKLAGLQVTIAVPAGEELAKKTLNHRLGIVGGISILGTTGIVRPLSAQAWTATITASMDVAKAAGLGTVVISSGRTSEKAHMRKYHFPEEAYAMMGDYLEFSLQDAKRHGFREVHLCAQWAKMLKAAMGTPQTHVRHGALEAKEAAEFLVRLGIDIPRDRPFNTSREIYDFMNSTFRDPHSELLKVCTAAKRYAEGITSGVPVIVHLVSYEGDILAESE